MMGYVIKSSENRLIIIDGGTKNQAEKLKKIINENGGVVEYWFITLPEQAHSGALLEIMKEANISINNICVSLNTEEWYEQYDTSNSKEIKEFMSELYSGDYRNIVQEVNLRDEIKVDNIFVKVLGIKNAEITESPSNNQNMIIKVNNNFKSILFLGDTGAKRSIDFKDDNLDEIKSDVVQISNHGKDTIETDIYNYIKASIYLTPSNINNDKINFKEQYTLRDGDIELTIW